MKRDSRYPTLCLLLLTAAFFAAPTVCAETVMIDGVEHVRNGTTPAGGIIDLDFSETWRHGGEDDEDFFGVVFQARADAEGNVCLVDGQLNEVAVYSPAGERLHTLGGTGEGPGELRGLTGVFFLPGGALGMIQAYPGKVITINADATPGSSFSMDTGGGANFGVLREGWCHDEDIYLAGVSMRMDGAVNTQTYFLSRCDLQGQEQVRFFAKENPINYANFVASEAGDHFVWGRWAIDTGGRLWAAPERNSYEIHVLDREGRLLRVIEREFASYRRTSEENGRVRDFVEAVNRNHPIPPQSVEIEETAPDIRQIWAMPDGRIWVQHSRSTENLPEGAAILLDVFGPDGNFVNQIALHIPWNEDQDIIEPLVDGRVVIMRGAADGYLTMMSVSSEGEESEAPLMEIICYEAQ